MLDYRKLPIACGNSCFAKVWKEESYGFEELCAKLKNTIRTPETVAEYAAMTKGERDRAKDKGGFVGGLLKDNRRNSDSVVCRSMLTLDADHAEPGFIERFVKNCVYTACLYTTHGHKPEAPRCRILVPLERNVSPDEFAAIARYFTAEWGIDQFDACSYRVSQLMYWPTTPKDGEYIFKVIDGEWLNPDVYLANHPEWRFCITLPVSSRENALRDTQRKHVEDPLSKVGFVGDFCRTYSIHDAIRVYLSDRYAATERADRYDYIPGEGSSGVVVYEDKFVYSHHATDPAGGRLLNAFDLVRVHLFGTDDEQLSYKNMCELVSADSDVAERVKKEKEAAVSAEFQPVTTETPADLSGWEEPLTLVNVNVSDFPCNALTPVLRDYAIAIAESTQTSPDMAAVGILAAVSAAMRNRYKVKGKADWLEPTNLFCLLIAEPSERKSAVISLLTKPLDEFVRDYNIRHNVEIEMSRAMKQKLENRKNSLISASRKKGVSEGGNDFNDELQDVVEQLVNFKEKKPLRVYVDDTTPEKLVETLADNDDSISIISSEGGIFDVLSGTYSNRVNIDVFLKAYSGEHISVDRIMRSSISVEEACLTVLLSVQPVVIDDLMKNDKFRHRGLTARFLYTQPKSMVGTRDFESQPIPVEAYQNYRNLIFNILSEERGPEAKTIHLDEAASKVLAEYYVWVEARLVDEFSVYGDWIGKLVGNTLRIAGILARSSVMKNVGDDYLAEDEEIVITEEIMKDAISIGRYFFAHAVQAYSTMGVSSDVNYLIKALDKIKEKQMHTICRRDLMRICRWLHSAEEAQKILIDLEDYGYLRLVSVDNSDKLRGGRPRNPVYAVNPRIL